MKTLFFIVLCLLASMRTTVAQSTPEEIIDLKHQLQSAKLDSARLGLYDQLAVAYRFSNIDSSLLYTEIALELAKEMRWQEAQAGILSLKGATLLESGRLPESLLLQFEAINISERVNNLYIKAVCLNGIGNTYMELADYKKANEYYFRSRDLYQSMNILSGYYNELSNIGNIYELMGLPDSALYYQKIVYEASIKSGDVRNFITWPEVMFRMGNAYKLSGDKKNALVFYRRGIVESTIVNDIRNLTMNNLFLAKLYKEMNIPDSSMKYANHAFHTGEAVSFRKGVYDASVLISELFENNKKYDSAYKYLLRANIEKDSLIGTKRFQELQGIVLGEQERQREAEAKRIASQNEQKQYALLVGLGVFLIIASILYRNNKQKQKTNKVLEQAISDLKSTQAQLIQSEKMASLGELTAGIAHEIQNPLNFVNNFSEVNTELIDEMQQEMDKGNLAEAKAISNDIKENEQKINHHGKRAGDIVKGMLQHSRSSSGVKEPTDINALADEYLRLAYHGLRAKDKSFNAELKTDFDSSIGNINIIPQDIGRVILNLINNAFYAVNERLRQVQPDSGYEPTVSVSTKKNGNKVLISVKDNGSGIPINIKDKIFQPFFTTKPTGQGTGLGLSLSYDIVKAHGGQVKMISLEGEGSEFIIQLIMI